MGFGHDKHVTRGKVGVCLYSDDDVYAPRSIGHFVPGTSLVHDENDPEKVMWAAALGARMVRLRWRGAVYRGDTYEVLCVNEGNSADNLVGGADGFVPLRGFGH